MKITSISFLRNYLLMFGLLAAVVFAVSSYILNSPQFQADTRIMSLAVTLDMTVLVPGLFYFLAVRKGRVSPAAVAPVFIACLAIASMILPQEHETYLRLVGSAAILAELSVFLYIVSRIFKVVKVYRELPSTALGFPEKLEQSLEKVAGKSFAVKVMAQEISMFYYCLTLKSQAVEALGEQSFSYHKNGGYSAFLGVVGILVIIEAIGVHYLVSLWNSSAAWVLTVLSIYTLLFIIAEYSATKKRPIFFNDRMFCFRNGLRWKADIPLELISECEQVVFEDWVPEKRVLNTAIGGCPDFILHFREPIVINGIYGLKKTITKLAFNIDNKEEFKLLIMELLPDLTPVS